MLSTSLCDWNTWEEKKKKRKQNYSLVDIWHADQATHQGQFNCLYCLRLNDTIDSIQFVWNIEKANRVGKEQSVNCAEWNLRKTKQKTKTVQWFRSLHQCTMLCILLTVTDPESRDFPFPLHKNERSAHMAQRVNCKRTKHGKQLSALFIVENHQHHR